VLKYLNADIANMNAQTELAGGQTASAYASAGLATAQTERLNQLTPIEVELAGLTLEQARELTPLETRNIKAQLEADYPLIQKRADVESQGLDVTSQGLSAKSKGIEASAGLIPLQEEAARSFYDQSLHGVNPEQWGMRAQNDVEQSFAGAQSGNRREAARMGLDPKSGNYAEQVRQLAIDKAQMGGSARAIGRTAGEIENYNRAKNAATTNPQIYGGAI